MTELKYYKLETNTLQAQCTFCGNISEDTEWRYFSLYNGARGAWCSKEEYAIEGGEAHKALIIALHMPVSPSLASRYPLMPTIDGWRERKR